MSVIHLNFIGLFSLFYRYIHMNLIYFDFMLYVRINIVIKIKNFFLVFFSVSYRCFIRQILVQWKFLLFPCSTKFIFPVWFICEPKYIWSKWWTIMNKIFVSFANSMHYIFGLFSTGYHSGDLSDSSDKSLDPTNFLILLSFLWTTLKVKELRFIQVYVWSSVNSEVKCCLWKYGSSIFSNSLRKIYQGLLKNSLLGFKQSLWAATGFIVIKLCLLI